MVITGKYQTSVFYVRTDKASVWYFPVMTALSVNKKLVVNYSGKTKTLYSKTIEFEPTKTSAGFELARRYS